MTTPLSNTSSPINSSEPVNAWEIPTDASENTNEGIPTSRSLEEDLESQNSNLHTCGKITLSAVRYSAGAVAGLALIGLLPLMPVAQFAAGACGCFVCLSIEDASHIAPLYFATIEFCFKGFRGHYYDKCNCC